MVEIFQVVGMLGLYRYTLTVIAEDENQAKEFVEFETNVKISDIIHCEDKGIIASECEYVRMESEN